MVGRPAQNAQEAMIADAVAAREEGLAAVEAIDPHAYGAPGCQRQRAMARELWENFAEIILQKESVCRRRCLVSLLTLSNQYIFQADSRRVLTIRRRCPKACAGHDKARRPHCYVILDSGFLYPRYAGTSSDCS
jgi:hypothetical protein